LKNYKVGDVVLIKSRAGEAIPDVHVRLLKRHHVKARKRNINKFESVQDPEYFYWDAVLVYEKEVDLLRKRWQIPFSFPNDVETCVFEEDVIKKVRKNKKRQTRNSYNKSNKNQTKN